jgi:DNA mismatch repair ATPase MutS
MLTVGLVGYVALGWLPWWLAPALGNLWVLRRIASPAGDAFRDSVLGGPPLRALVPQLDLLSGQEAADPALRAVVGRLGRGEDAARRHLDRLSRLLDFVESRRNLVYATLAPVLLLDVHLYTALDRWRTAHGAAARDWLEALGEWEALSALATLAYDHPDWTYPKLATGSAPELKAKALGHPLLPPTRCVRNDVTVGPSGTFLFVTGSNMSGKSTLLRALGANAVLANAGAPVCAVALSLPPVRVHTSMRIEDSLAEGISLFMAELLRIKQVVEAAGSTDGAGRPVLYLIDEILHGTNTAERRIAARGVVRHLLGSGAIGAVSSHDLTLAEAPEIESAAQAVHFREEVGSADDAGAVLTFDFKLREGVATTRNALKLLEAVGLGELGVEAEGHGTDLPTEA